LTALLLWAVPGLPAAAGALLTLLRPTSRRVAWGIAIGVAAVTVLLAVAALLLAPAVQAPFLLGTVFGLAVDPLAGTVLVTVTVVALLVVVFAAADVERSPARFGGLMLLFVAAVAVTVTATTLPTLLVAWEVMGATSYALIGFAWDEPGKTEAGAVAFLVTRAGDLGLYLAAGAALAGGSGLGLADLAGAPEPWGTVVAAGLVVAALGKAAQLPFSFWLSKAMQGPSPVSALLHSAAMVAMGGYLLLRVPGLLAATPTVAGVTAWAGALTAVALGVVAVAQRDLKQLLAASTAAQLGFVVLAAGVGGVTAGATQLVAHAATKALLFLTAGAWLSALGTKQLAALPGAARRWPLVGGAATLGLASLAGVAPLSLWASKEAVLAAALPHSALLYGVGLVGAALSAAYAGRVLAVIWQPVAAAAEPVADLDQQQQDTGQHATPDEAELDTEERGTRTVSALMRSPLVVLAAGAAGLGVLVWPPVAAALRSAFGDPASPDPGAAELVGSAALALVVLVVVWRRPPPAPGWALHWLHLEAAASWLVVTPTLRAAAWLARFDDRVVDRGVTAVAGATVRLARRLAAFDDRGIDAAVGLVARAVRRAGRAAVRPQTGQLYQYYLQSVAVLAGAVVLLLLVR
jgi:NADH:ubiquinone oxidoreductase subunit 5 (subunit L)/multisubunit Na+/H+ antiporter MnhA subunit